MGANPLDDFYNETSSPGDSHTWQPSGKSFGSGYARSGKSGGVPSCGKGGDSTGYAPGYDKGGASRYDKGGAGYGSKGGGPDNGKAGGSGYASKGARYEPYSHGGSYESASGGKAGDARSGGGKGGYDAYKGKGGGGGWSSGGAAGGYADSGGWGNGYEGSNYSELGANLKDIDWSKEAMEDKMQVSGEYQAAADARSAHDVEAWRKSNGITTWGRDVPNPIFTFEETGFPQWMLDGFYKQGFKAPTMIQSQGWGPAMAGRDVVGVAKTGSGKTLAFGIPGLLHIEAQPKLNRGDGPLMLVLAPTRELGQQIHAELAKVLPYQMRAAVIYGGSPKWEQKKELQYGVHCLVATPGRLIDFIESGVTNLRRVTYLVMDEADRMLDMGFEPDVRKIVGQIRPDRQTLLWSATWPKSVQKLARDFQKDIVHIQVGSSELSANTDITQKIVFTHGWQQKQQEIVRQLWDLDSQGIKKVLVFAGTKKGCEELSQVIRQGGFQTAAIHGDKEQYAREQALGHLKSKPRFVLVATDVASRGLDIPLLPAVINFDMPDQMEDYIHRIGRTGRAGNKGLAISFFTPAKDCGHARKLIDILKQAGQHVPEQLQQATSMSPPDKPRFGGKKSGGGGGGGWGGGGGGWSSGKGGGKGGGGKGGGSKGGGRGWN